MILTIGSVSNHLGNLVRIHKPKPHPPSRPLASVVPLAQQLILVDAIGGHRHSWLQLWPTWKGRSLFKIHIPPDPARGSSHDCAADGILRLPTPYAPHLAHNTCVRALHSSRASRGLFRSCSSKYNDWHVGRCSVFVYRLKVRLLLPAQLPEWVKFVICRSVWSTDPRSPFSYSQPLNFKGNWTFELVETRLCHPWALLQ